jgi:hypothetical protein
VVFPSTSLGTLSFASLNSFIQTSSSLKKKHQYIYIYIYIYISFWILTEEFLTTFNSKPVSLKFEKTQEWIKHVWVYYGNRGCVLIKIISVFVC